MVSYGSLNCGHHLNCSCWASHSQLSPGSSNYRGLALRSGSVECYPGCTFLSGPRQKTGTQVSQTLCSLEYCACHSAGIQYCAQVYRWIQYFPSRLRTWRLEKLSMLVNRSYRAVSDQWSLGHLWLFLSLPRGELEEEANKAHLNISPTSNQLPKRELVIWNCRVRDTAGRNGLMDRNCEWTQDRRHILCSVVTHSNCHLYWDNPSSSLSS